MRINILYIIWSLGLGGAERVVINLVKGLDKKRFYPLVCCLNEKGILAEELEKEGITVIALYKKNKFDFSIINKLIRLMKKNNIDIVHTHLWGANFWGRVAAKKNNVSVIIATEHSSDNWKSEFKFFLDRWLARSTNKIIAVSNSVKEFYVSKGIDESKIYVIYNGIEIENIQKNKDSSLRVREEFGIKDDEKVLAIIGRLISDKGHRYLFDALEKLNGCCNIKLLVVGEGPLLQYLRSIVYEQQLHDKVIFTGLRKDVKDILGVTDIVVMPSLREGLPMVALEAMSQGVPMIATKVGGVPEVVLDGQTGVLVPAEDSNALAEKIIALLQNDSLRRTMGEKGYERVKNSFLLSHMIKNTENLYETQLRSRKCPG